MDLIRRGAVPLVLIMLVIAGGLVYLQDQPERNTVTAFFPRTVSLYEGSDVRVLGVAVGTVDEIEPEGQQVKVTMSYDAEVQVPRSASAVIVSPAIVGDRYVQLTPAFEDGDEVLPRAAVLSTSSEIPLELDEIYAGIDEITVALGPDGANSEGALSDLLQVTAANFGGQGENFNTTIKNFGKLSTTLDNNKEELFGAARELQQFIGTLADNDQVVRDFNRSLGRVSSLLAGERRALVRSVRNLATALVEVRDFVADNREVLGDDIRDLDQVLQVLVRRRSDLDEILKTAPVALNNLALTYNPDAGTLDTNSNISNLVTELETNPSAVLCALVSANDENGSICDLIESLPLPRTAPFGYGTGSGYTAPTDGSLGGVVPGAAASDPTTQAGAR